MSAASLGDMAYMPDVSHEGWLWKQGYFNVAYRRRYFRLLDGELLSYYENETNKKPKGQVYLATMTLKDMTSPREEETHAFILQPFRRGGRVYRFKAETHASKEGWVSAILTAQV